MSKDGLDHVLFLFQTNKGWGTIGKSRDAGLHGRKPAFRSIRDLVFSYVEPYIDKTGRLVGYGVTDLNVLTTSNWRLSDRNVWSIEKALIAMSHKRLKTSDSHYRRTLDRFLRFKEANPQHPFPFEDRAGVWL
jgi:hypothetical protein